MPDYNNHEFNPLITQIETHLNRILSNLTISTPSGKSTVIKLNIDNSKSEKISAYAKRKSKEPGNYEVIINAGMSHYLRGYSSVFAFEELNLLSWTEQCKINDERIKKLGKKEILAGYAFFLGSYFILLHEISHIVLGHLDYLIDEIDKESRNSPENIKIKKAFEAEADRQAGELLLFFFENSLGKNGLGGDLSFPSRLHVYEFYVYAITTVFRMLQDLSQKEGGVHPKPNERLYTLIASLSKYFNQNLPDQHDRIYIHAVKSCLEAGKKLQLIDSYAPWTVIQNAHNLAFVDRVVKETNLRRYQHKLEVVSAE